MRLDKSPVLRYGKLRKCVSRLYGLGSDRRPARVEAQSGFAATAVAGGTPGERTVKERKRTVAAARAAVGAARETTGAGTGTTQAGAGTAASRERKTEATTGGSTAGQQATSRPLFSTDTQTESANARAQVRSTGSATAKPFPLKSTRSS